MAKKRAKAVVDTKVAATKTERAGRAVRLDLTDPDHDRLERLAGARGLSKASYCRMAVLERMKTDEARD